MDTQNQTPSNSMLSRKLVVQNKMGIHARPAAMIVRVTNNYADTEVWVEKDGETINAKSIMGLMMLAAGHNTTLHFSASGPNDQAVLDDLTAVFENKFEEV